MELRLKSYFSVENDQPDSRQIQISIHLMKEGTCSGECLFSFDSLNTVVKSATNIPIVDADTNTAIGVIPENNNHRWEIKLINGKWGNYATVDAVLWTKLVEAELNSDQMYEMTVELTDIVLGDDGNVVSFKISSCSMNVNKTDSSNANYTRINRYGKLRTKGGKQ